MDKCDHPLVPIEQNLATVLDISLPNDNTCLGVPNNKWTIGSPQSECRDEYGYRYGSTIGMTYISYTQARRCPPGEKVRNFGKEPGGLLGGLRTDSLSRVLESRICIVFSKPAAINWPHGDQTA